jgi:hypothetical protein
LAEARKTFKAVFGAPTLLPATGGQADEDDQMAGEKRSLESEPVTAVKKTKVV